jgi:hypothetical protein
MPERYLQNEVLPDPLFPKIPTLSPFLICKLILSSNSTRSLFLKKKSIGEDIAATKVSRKEFAL